MRVDSQLAMAVLPASCQIDLSAFKKLTKAKSICLAAEPEFEIEIS